jgi:hypothetical protein
MGPKTTKRGDVGCPEYRAVDPRGRVQQVMVVVPTDAQEGEAQGYTAQASAGQIAVQEREQVGGCSEADRGHAGVTAVIVEDVAGLLDVVADAGGGDLQEFSKHVHGADLPLVHEREQEPRGIVEERLVSDLPAGPPGPAAALFAVALLGAGGLGRSEPGGELL